MTNSNLITVFNGQISNQSVQLANARELHEFLEVKSQFGHWITDRITDYGFTENEDYIIVTERTAGRPRKEYHITLDMGKELAMVERNEKGRQIRKYFIECEKQARLQNQQQNLPLVEEKKYTFEHTKEQGLRLVSLWHSAYRMAKILGELEPALSMLGSTFAPMAHSCSKEYQITLTLAHKELTRMLDGVEVSPRENAHFYKVLSDLRQWQPKGFLRKIS